MAQAQPYTGEIMLQCVQPFNFKQTFVVVVSGDTWNPCGHMLLNTGGQAGWYFHVAAVRGKPRFMREPGFQRYLKEHKKRELRRTFIPIPNPDGTNAKLEEFLAKQWTWFVVPNNCCRLSRTL
jgi:hypothetical protein